MSEQPLTNNRNHKQFSLSRGLGIWDLTFNYRDTYLANLKGVTYIRYLLYHPDDSIHGLELGAKTSQFLTSQSGTEYMVNPETGLKVPVNRDSVIQERSLHLDTDISPVLGKKLRELKAIMEDEGANDAERREAEEEYHEIWSSLSEGNLPETAELAARAIRKAIARFYDQLARSVDARGEPHPVLRQFAEHLDQYLILPSSRLYVRRGQRGERGYPGGRFIYQPPPGVTWT
jgi:hypothetical protein